MECLMNRILAAPLSGEQIERLSFDLIDAESVRGSFSPGEWTMVRRLVHTTGDPLLSRKVRFHGDWMVSGIAALRRKSLIYCDSAMVAAGISIERLRRVHPEYSREDVVVKVSDPEVARLSRITGLPRSFHAVGSCASWLDGAIALFGNAPVGLAELLRLHHEDGIRPGWIAAMPVGFVHVRESKEEFLRSELDGVAVAGLRGGSPLAVAALHALCTLAEEDRP